MLKLVSAARRLEPEAIIEAPDGSSAAWADDHFEVRDRRGSIVFTYDPDTGKGELSMPGDLSLAAPAGNIDLIAGKAVRCFAAEGVSFDSAGRVALTSHAESGRSALELGEQGARLATPKLRMDARDADVNIHRSRFRGQSLDSHIERGRLAWDVVENVAERVISRARNVFESVSEAKQTRAGTVRAVVEDSYEILSGMASLLARKDIRIDAQQIDLG